MKSSDERTSVIPEGRYSLLSESTQSANSSGDPFRCAAVNRFFSVVLTFSWNCGPISSATSSCHQMWKLMHNSFCAKQRFFNLFFQSEFLSVGAILGNGWRALFAESHVLKIYFEPWKLYISLCLWAQYSCKRQTTRLGELVFLWDTLKNTKKLIVF